MDSALWTALLVLEIICTFIDATRLTQAQDLRPQRTHKRHVYFKQHFLEKYEDPNIPPIRHSKFSKLDEFLRQYFNYENKQTNVEESRTNDIDAKKKLRIYSSNKDYDQDCEDNDDDNDDDDDNTIKPRTFSADENFLAAAVVNNYAEQTDSDESYENINEPKKIFLQVS